MGVVVELLQEVVVACKCFCWVADFGVVEGACALLLDPVAVRDVLRVVLRGVDQSAQLVVAVDRRPGESRLPWQQLQVDQQVVVSAVCRDWLSVDVFKHQPANRVGVDARVCVEGFVGGVVVQLTDFFVFDVPVSAALFEELTHVSVPASRGDLVCGRFS